MYDTRPNLVIGFHGCDRETRDMLLDNPKKIKKSEKPYDWLGHGMYFWEYNEQRAQEWGDDYVKRGKIKEAVVVGAVLNLRNCCDLLDSKYIDLVAAYYNPFKISNSFLGNPMPENKDVKGDPHKDKLRRELDCAVIEYMHERIFTQQQRLIASRGDTNITPFDSVREAHLWKVEKRFPVRAFSGRTTFRYVSAIQIVFWVFFSLAKKSISPKFSMKSISANHRSLECCYITFLTRLPAALLPFL
jgi:hypothetical protein